MLILFNPPVQGAVKLNKETILSHYRLKLHDVLIDLQPATSLPPISVVYLKRSNGRIKTVYLQFFFVFLGHRYGIFIHRFFVGYNVTNNLF